MFQHDPEGFVRNCAEPSKFESRMSEMYFDLGAYGVPKCVREGKEFDGPAIVRLMGQFAIEKHGFQLLYSDVFITREEFEKMFNLSLYEQMRKKYNAERAFPHVWDKIKPQKEVS